LADPIERETMADDPAPQQPEAKQNYEHRREAAQRRNPAPTGSMSLCRGRWLPADALRRDVKKSPC
jgi:hypothetical protein